MGFFKQKLQNEYECNMGGCCKSTNNGVCACHFHPIEYPLLILVIFPQLQQALWHRLANKLPTVHQAVIAKRSLVFKIVIAGSINYKSYFHPSGSLQFFTQNAGAEQIVKRNSELESSFKLEPSCLRAQASLMRLPCLKKNN
jgi:hypothetical protein